MENMENVDFLIIGGGIAGTTAAETIRTENPTARIVIVEDEKYPLYSRVQIPYYLRGIKTREQIFLRTLESYKEKSIEYLINKTVISLNTWNSTLATSDCDVFHYGKLLITTGGSPKKLNKYKNEHSMQTIDDADKILEDVKKAKKGVVIGSGFIALEFLETFLHYSLEAYICISKEGFWANFLSPEASKCISSILSQKGAKVYFGDTPDFLNDTDVMIGTGIGLDISKPFFKDSGLTFDGGLVTDHTLKTNIENVYAAGDVAKFYSKKLDRYVRYGNYTNALVSGKYAGLNMLGKDQTYDTLSAYSISSDKLSIVFLGFAGIDEFTQTKTKVLSETECIQFFIRKGKLDGCILINRSQDRKAYQSVIESRSDFQENFS